MYSAVTTGQPMLPQFASRFPIGLRAGAIPGNAQQSMPGSTLFGDPDAIDRDLFFLECAGEMRVQFYGRICEKSASQDERTLDVLRLEAAYQLAEFYYSLLARGITTPEQIEVLTKVHNDYIIALTKDRQKMARLGLTSERLLDAMFTADTLPRLLQNWREKPGAIDQSNLARFLATVMSTETCRKVVVACHAAGFVDRERTHYGTMVISSLGVMEEIFGQCLRDARTKLTRWTT
jgi:hypothetical protein